MAPFRLKFRMGSSRSTSQEVDSSTTSSSEPPNNPINSNNSMSQGSIGNDKKCLLPNESYKSGLGYMNPVSSQSNTKNYTNKNLSDPPSYENGLDLEDTFRNFGSRLTISTADGVPSTDNCENHHNNEQICSSTPNISPNSQHEQQQSQQSKSNNEDDRENDNLRKDSLDSTQYLISSMTTPSSQENLIDGDDCTGSCEPLFSTSNCDKDGNNSEEHMHCEENLENHLNDEPEICYGNDGNASSRHYNHNNYIDYSQLQQVISNKSSKKIYKAVAKQWGITCKMTDQCRCMDCQSNYFDCEYDQNDHQKTDGGLGATTPMFISEVMHGNMACCIL